MPSLFNQRFPGRPYQRASEPLHRQVFHQHSQGVSQKDLARYLHCGKSTIERWYYEGYSLRHKKIAHRSCPRVLGIDEHFFNKKQGYATTFCDLAKHKIFDIVKGRSEKDLNTYLNTLEGKDKVRVVCIDLSPSYRALIKSHFPNAKIVADRFMSFAYLINVRSKLINSLIRTININAACWQPLELIRRT